MGAWLFSCLGRGLAVLVFGGGAMSEHSRTVKSRRFWIFEEQDVATAAVEHSGIWNVLEALPSYDKRLYSLTIPQETLS